MSNFNLHPNKAKIKFQISIWTTIRPSSKISYFGLHRNKTKLARFSLALLHQCINFSKTRVILLEFWIKKRTFCTKNSNDRSSNRTIPIEDQLRAKFLDETSPTDPIVNETNRRKR